MKYVIVLYIFGSSVPHPIPNIGGTDMRFTTLAECEYVRTTGEREANAAGLRTTVPFYSKCEPVSENL